MPIYVTKNRTNAAELLCILEYDWCLNIDIGSEKKLFDFVLYLRLWHSVKCSQHKERFFLIRLRLVN